MSPVTKNTYIDNFNPEIPGTIEIGVFNKKAFIKYDTLEVINPTNIINLEKYQAYKIALNIARQRRTEIFRRKAI